MKVLANETKRILAVLLSVAMIFAYVPSNVAAYAELAPSETVTVHVSNVSAVDGVASLQSARTPVSGDPTYATDQITFTQGETANVLIKAVLTDGYKASSGVLVAKLTNNTAVTVTDESIDAENGIVTGAITVDTLEALNNGDAVTVSIDTQKVSPILNKVAVAGTDGLTVEYKTTGGYSGVNPYETGLAAASLADLYIKVSAPAGKQFAGAVTAGVTGDNANSGADFVTAPAAGNKYVEYMLPAADFTTTGYVDITSTVTFANTTLEDATYQTGAITGLGHASNRTITMTGVENGETAPLSAATGTLEFSVTPDAGYVTNHNSVTAGGVTATKKTGKTDVFGGSDAESVYEFSATEGTTYVLAATVAQKPKVSAITVPTHFTASLEANDLLDGGTNYLVLTNNDENYEIASISIADSNSILDPTEYENFATQIAACKEVDNTGAGVYEFYVKNQAASLGKTISITITEQAKSSAIAVASTSYDIDVAAGARTSTTFNATKSGSPVEVEWKLYKGTTEIEPSSLGLAADTSTKGQCVLSGRPSAVLADATYTLKAKDTSVTSGLTGSVDFTFAVTDRDADLKWDANTAPTGDTKLALAASKSKGYTTVTPWSVYVKNDSATDAIKVDSIELTGTNQDKFALSGHTFTSLDTGEVKKVDITPASDLPAGVYKASLVLNSTYLTGGKATLADVTFTVKDEIVIKVNGQEATLKDSSLAGASKMPGSTYDIDLGTFQAGSEIPEGAGGITVTATGTSGTSAWTAITTTELQNAVTGLSASSGGHEDIKIYGTLKAVSYDQNLTATENTHTGGTDLKVKGGDGSAKTTVYYIPMTLTDGVGDTRVYTGVLHVTAADVSFAIDSDPVTFTNDAASYNWYAADPTAESAERTIVVTNNSKVDMTVVATMTSTNITVNGSNTSSKEIKAGKTANFVIKGAADADKTDTLTFAVADKKTIDEKTFTLSVGKINGITMVSPASTSTVWGTSASPISLDAGIYGYQYDFVFKAVSDLANPVFTYELGENGVDTDGVVNTTSELQYYGLTLDEATGKLTGILDGDYEDIVLGLKVTDTAHDASKYGYFKIPVGGATKALTVSDSKGNVYTKDSGIEIATSTDGREAVYYITMTNGSSVYLEDVDVAVENQKKDGANNSHGRFTLTQHYNDTINSKYDIGIKDSTSASQKFELKITDRIPVGVYTADVNIKDSNNQVIATIPVSVTSEQRPEITGGDIAKLSDGTSLVVNKAITSAIKLAATDTSGNALTDGSWSWAIAEDGGTTLPGGLALSATGEITGTPTSAGEYKVTISVAQSDGVVGTKDVTVKVKGSSTVSLYKGSATDLVTCNNGSGLYLFDGAAVGDATPPTELDVNVNHTSGEAISTLNIGIKDAVEKDADGNNIFEGSSTKFTLSTTTISNLAVSGTKQFTITPNNTTIPGTYRAIVTVSGVQVSPVSFYVQYTVSEKLNVTAPSAKNLSGIVGDPYFYELEATGAGTVIDEDQVVDKNNQVVTWYLTSDTSANLTKKYLELLNEAGITSISNTGATERAIEDDALFSLALKNAKDYTFTVRAKVAEGTKVGSIDKLDGTGPVANAKVLSAKEQKADYEMTLKVAKTGKVYVSNMTKTNGTPVDQTTRDIDGDNVNDKEYISYTFNEQPFGKYMATNVKDEFTLSNVSDVSVDVTPEITGAGKDAFKLDVTAKASIAAEGTKVYELSLSKDDLAVGTYEANVVFTGDSVNTITIPVKLVVAEPVYDIKFYDGTTELTEATVEMPPSIKEGTSSTQTLVIGNAGNIAADMYVTEVANAAGDDVIGDESKRKLDIAGFAYVNLNDDGTDGTAYTINSPINATKKVKATVKLNANALKTAGAATAYFKIDFKEAGTVKATKIVTVNYTVLNAAVADVTIDPNETTVFTSSEEGYSKTELAKTFKVTNSISGTAVDVANSLSNVKVVLDGTDKDNFEIDGPVLSYADDAKTIISEYGTKLLPEGEELSFKVQPVEGLAYGSYNARVVVTADNLSSAVILRVPITYTVTASDSVKVNANSDGAAVKGTFGSRLFNTMVKMNSASSKAVFKVDGNTYNVDLNGGTASATNYDVQVARVGGTYAVIKGEKCDVRSYENVLTCTGATKGTEFATMTFAIFDKVIVNVEETAGDVVVVTGSDEKKHGWADAKTYGTNADGTITYYVPHLGTIKDVKGTVNTNDANPALIPSVTGLPEIFNADETVSLDSWWNNPGKEAFSDTTLVSKDINYVGPKWHDHVYAVDSTDTAHVVWNWPEKVEDYLTTGKVTVTLTCISPDCPDTKTHGAITLTAIVVKSGSEATLSRPGGVTYTATVGNYTDTKIIGESPALGYVWDYTKAQVTYEPDGSKASLTLPLKNTEGYDPKVDGDNPVIMLNTDMKGETLSGNCVTPGSVKYTAIFKDADKNIDYTDTTGIVVEGVLAPHTYGFVLEWNDDHETAKTAKLVCSVCPEGTEGHEVDVLSKVKYDITRGTDGKVSKNVATVTYEGIDYTETFIDDILYAPSVKFTWPKEYVKGTTINVTWSGTVKSKNNSGKTQEIKGTATVNPTTVSAGNADKKIEFTATADLSAYWKDEAMSAKAENATDKKTYNFKNGSVSGNTGGDAESGKTPSEPSEDTPNYKPSLNLFYTGFSYDLPDFPSGADVSGTMVNGKPAKWATYYQIENGTVTLKDGVIVPTDVKNTEKRLKAAAGAGALINLPVKDDSGNIIGEYEYTLPVYYQKPVLKLTKTKGTINKNVTYSEESPAVLHTTVTEKKATGNYEALDLSDMTDEQQAKIWAAKSNSAPVKVELGDNAGELVVNVQQTGKASGTINIQLENWAIPAKALSYSVALSKKDVLEVSTTKVLMNSHAVENEQTPDTQKVVITVNGEIPAEDDITITKDGKKFDTNIALSEKVDSEGVIEVGYGADGKTALAKGTSKFKVTTKGNVSKTISIVVSDKALNDAGKPVSFKSQSKLNATTGQKAVLIPTLKTIGGPITDVQNANLGGAFAAEWNDDLQQIIIGYTDTPDTAKGQKTLPVNITAGGVTFQITLKFYVETPKPAVKVDKVELKKAQVKAEAGADGTASYLCTYTKNGKKYAMKPDKVEFYNGTAKLEKVDGGDYDYTFTKGSGTLSFTADEDNQVIKLNLKDAKAKNIKVKVWCYFGNNIVKKDLSVKCVN